MILAALALFSAAVQEPPLEPMTEAEIVIVGQRLQGVTVNVGRDPKGRWHCGMTGSTGYPKLDERLCRATTKCVQKGKSDDAAIQACVAKTKPGLIAELRKRARGGK
ncbi:hypothetical protein FPZ54_11410 [Sphingomonas suaedae]|uniref:Uncharacterized protein n=1 Tax=Sphingomonas suaedae TaxID=2599297 RepID=A0A518RGI0_9SPHN|nr:hypothetical protein [Sphingomonas suaedae]QDX26568.1 hypothetical protein FPZ54_11410 [Sphingomonas suaedae]